MDMVSPRAQDPPSAFEDLAVAVLDHRGSILQWSDAAAALTGMPADEACGRSVRELLVAAPEACAGSAAGVASSGRVLVRLNPSATVDVTYRATPLNGSDGFLVLAAPTQHVTDQVRGVALLRALSSQHRIGIALHDIDMTITQTNGTTGLFGGPPIPIGGLPHDVLAADDAEAIASVLREVLETGTPVVRSEHWVHLREDAARQWGLSLSAFRLEDARGSPTGVAAIFFDTTQEILARRHLELARAAAVRVGGSLEVRRTAQDLADVLVPDLGEHAVVALAQAVFTGEELLKWVGGGDLHLVHAAIAPADRPLTGVEIGDAVPPLRDNPRLRSLQRGKTVTVSRDGLIAELGDPRLVELLLPESFHAVMSAPLYARGFLLGNVTVFRLDRSDPFTEQDSDLLSDVASRAALAIDNARRYTREHRAAVALQERLLPPATTDTPAAQTAGAYLPAGGGAEIGGDWFDAMSLPSLRLALVVGDVVGHGMHASAGMGRLRAAIQTLADLELEPEELLARLADLVQRLAAEASPAEQDAVGATCLYAVYDPVSGRCSLASAGHPPPIVVRPDGTARILDISTGPPLTVGGMPYETLTFDIEPGSVFALYTDGLIENSGQDLDEGMRRLADRLTASCRPECDLAAVGREVLADFSVQPRQDDMALLLARTRAISDESTAHWDFEADPALVSEARESVTRQLAAWGLDHLAFTTELIVSELVTNAIRYGGGPVGLRLIRHDVLICEVTDPSSTQPRLRRARATDEGGRGLLLVAQLTHRWGCRYGQSGKTIWAEQPVEATG
ncbi:hypothetical protein GCM10012280_58390 [Wenjunlia tyrosinilytica]|uniref:protein-serine/threonine phosphatase n=2 Tax=Wenjunlia tyrosinilytica TaxID=1544741 RepID=A0A917ZX87_9ACTN|nr:SpoIIE family protein phosphatase [Wenjunlia tyrosinilytica]GGO97179.1 hypothetical protein GCM10012280_58390 [Wenjunlia tyrosinilytica]